MPRHLRFRHENEATPASPRRRRTARVSMLLAGAMALALVPLGLSHHESTAEASSPSWKLVFSDEFNDSTVNTTKWRVRNNSWASNDLSILTSRSVNVAESGGALRIKGKRETFTAYSMTRNYTSGYLDGRSCFKYGSFQMRAKLPTHLKSSQGMWPAFWLRPQNGGDGEIDIMEAVGSSTYDNYVSHTLWYDYKGTKPRQTAAGWMPAGTTRSGSYHTYFMTWGPTKMQWFVDGKLMYERNSSNTPWVTDARFQQPYCIRLNLQIGGKWPGSPNSATDFSQAYSIDWIRVYQHV
jgi:beta-glucanase (GH16 family)